MPTALVECPHAPRCGGCALIELPYPAQLDQKREAVRSALGAYSELQQLQPSVTLPAATIEKYRTRAKLVVAGTHIGLYAKASHTVVDVPECRVLRPVVARAVDAVRSALPFSFPLLALDVREVDSGALVTLIVPPETNPSEARAVAQQLVARHAEVVGVSWSLRAREAPTLLGSAPVFLAGRASAPHRLAADGPFHEAVPGSFVQAHAGQAARLHAAVEQTLERVLGEIRGKRVVDLYAGGGALALRLAARGARVTAVDSFAPGLCELNRAAERQDLQLTVLALPVEQALANLELPDAVIVNPPRRGLSTLTRALLSRLRPPLILYISCEPRRLARDLAHFARLGLGTRKIMPIDMIPLTDSVETLAEIVPEAPPPLEILHQDERLIAVEKPAHVPMTAADPGCRFFMKAVRELSGCEDAVALQARDTGTSGVCLFARHPDHVASLSTAAANARHTFVALVSGITHKKGVLRNRAERGSQSDEAQYQRDHVAGTHSLVRVITAKPWSGWIQKRFAELGHPLLGDGLYGSVPGNRYFEARFGLDRPFLHCLELELPLAAGSLTIASRLAPDLAVVLEQLERTKPTARADSSRLAGRREL